MIGRPGQGLKDLANPAVGANYDSQLWKALAYARQGKWAEAREKFKNVEFAIASLPLDLQRIAISEAMRASLEIKDYSSAARRGSDLEVVGVPPDMKPAVSVLRGRIAEALGHDKDALDQYKIAAESSDRPASTEARLLNVALLQKRDEITQPDALRELETLSVMWRGDGLEVQALVMMSRIYSDTGQAIREALELLCDPADAIEIRAPSAKPVGAKAPANIVKRFPPGAFDAAAAWAVKLSGYAPAVYRVMNGVKPGNSPTGRGKAATAADVPWRRVILIDVDPVRPPASSSTEAEKEEALKVVEAVRTHLDGLGWPAPVLADSGNGWHLLYRVDLPNDDAATELVKAALHALARRFDTGEAKVDTAVFDAPRLVKLYGTKACKGPDTAERPHRFASVVEVPGTIEVVPVEKLEALAGEGRPVRGGATTPAAPVVPSLRKSSARTAGRRSAEERAVEYLNKCQPAVEGDDGSGQTLKVCIAVGPGFNLPPEVTYRLVSEHYNPRCVPTWPPNLLQRKVDEAYRKELNRGWLLDAPRRNGTAAVADRHPEPPSMGPNALNGHVGGNGRPSAPPAEPPPNVTRNGDGSGRPEIVITTEEHEVIDQAAAALAAEPNVFQRLNELVTVLREPEREKPLLIYRPCGSPRIAPLPAPRLRDLMTKAAAWKKASRDRNGDVDNVPAHPPDWAVKGLAARGNWSEIRPIEGIIEAPVLRTDGTVIDRRGYDASTNLLYEPNGKFPPIPANPTREDARYAAEVLLDLVSDFPFAGEGDRAAWLAGLLTPLARYAIRGFCPLFLIDGNVRGVGKSMLTDLIGLVSTGRKMPRTAYTGGSNDEEMRKRMMAIGLAGDRLMLLDNINGMLGDAILDSALTAELWKDRKLGTSEMTAEMPMLAVWYANGNNLGYRADVIRRIVYCRLDSPVERPEERSDFRIKGDFLEHVSARRPELVVAALTILKAHAVAGRPSGNLVKFGSFEAWSGVVRSAIHWATGIDPCSTREALRAMDHEEIEETTVIEGWAELPYASERGVTIAEALRFIASPDHQDKYTTLRDALMLWSKDDRLPSARVIGNRFKKLRGAIRGSHRFDQAGDYKHAQVWKVTDLRS